MYIFINNIVKGLYRDGSSRLKYDHKYSPVGTLMYERIPNKNTSIL